MKQNHYYCTLPNGDGYRTTASSPKSACILAMGYAIHRGFDYDIIYVKDLESGITHEIKLSFSLNEVL